MIKITKAIIVYNGNEAAGEPIDFKKVIDYQDIDKTRLEVLKLNNLNPEKYHVLFIYTQKIIISC